MKRYFNKGPAIWLLSLIILIIACKRSDITPSNGNTGSSGTTSSIKENDLFTINENGLAVLHVKSRLGTIFIDNEQPGTNLGLKNTYKIISSYGGAYEFSSSKNFDSRTSTGLFGLVKIFRNDKLLFEEKYDTTNAHICSTINSYIPSTTKDNHTSSIGAAIYYWPNSSTITVNFLNNAGSTYVKQKIEQYAHAWEPYANIKFKFVPSTQSAQIRIGIAADNSSYTTGLGTMLIDPNNLTEQGLPNTDQSSPNMHYGWFTDQTSDQEFSRTVTHEFGHALGLEHEQRHYDAHINESAYFSYLMSTQHWTLQQAQNQAAFFTAQDQTELRLQYDPYDRLSIMHYPIPASCTTDGVAIGSNNYLSDGDKAFIGKVYPFITVPPNPTNNGTVIYTINNDSGVAQIDIVRGSDGLIMINNRLPNTSLNSEDQKYIILTRTQNGDWYRISYTFTSNTILPSNTSTGITNWGPSKGQSIMIERQDPGQSLGTILFKE